jgi:hypothetical protein
MLVRPHIRVHTRRCPHEQVAELSIVNVGAPSSVQGLGFIALAVKFCGAKTQAQIS